MPVTFDVRRLLVHGVLSRMLGSVPFGDSHFRHSLRNHLNSLTLGIAVCDASPLEEFPAWMDMIERTADECLQMLDANPPGNDAELEFPDH